MGLTLQQFQERIVESGVLPADALASLRSDGRQNCNTPEELPKKLI